MRKNCVPLRPNVAGELMDTCGTGGGISTFNISTATAFVAAAAGIAVAKHGSRSIASRSGSADVLEALGAEIQLPRQALETMIEQIGLAFIYAPQFHPVMARVLPTEQSLGIKTIFYSVIGPLTNPALASRHLLGVYKPELLDVVASVAKEIGFSQAMIVHGLDGVDEISVLGKTRIHELLDGMVSVYEIAPEDFGLERCAASAIAAAGPAESAALIRGVFVGTIQGAPRDAIVLNSAGALKVGGKADTFARGVALARELIDSGVVDRKLRQFVEMSRSFGGRDRARVVNEAGR
jgi:anthranilate phosphoribosyltransferase